MARHTRKQVNYARAMRQDSTWGEIRLWQELRRSQLGVRFRRQEPVGPYITDFACHAARLIVEIDGSSHNFRDETYAQRRDRWLRDQGWTVLHFTERYVLSNTEGALEVIRRALTDPTFPPPAKTGEVEAS